MKIARVIDEQGDLRFVEVRGKGLSPQSVELFRLEGSPGAWQQTQQPVRAARWLPPLEPAIVYAIGMNYALHAAEFGNPIPKFPVVFVKASTSLLPVGEPIRLPRGLRSDKVDYEVELAVVIGKSAKNVPVERALEYVAGYTIANDVSARDWQHRDWGGGQFSRAKSFDTFCPLGPWLVTPDEIPDPQALRLWTEVNGDLRQDSNTGDMIFSVAELISFLSGSTTLVPGTVILTGTPSGVGGGRKPPLFLQAGDTVAVNVEKIGELRNPVAEETL